MSKVTGEAYNPVNGSIEEIWEGFSWACLVFGFLWYIYKGMWAWGAIALILAFCTFGVSWLIFPFFANGQYAQSLLRQGYLNEKQWKQRTTETNRRLAQVPQHGIADELAKLVALKEQGILSDEELQKQKLKLLS
jgi:hypothetical protein